MGPRKVCEIEGLASLAQCMRLQSAHMDIAAQQIHGSKTQQSEHHIDVMHMIRVTPNVDQRTGIVGTSDVISGVTFCSVESAGLSRIIAVIAGKCKTAK